MKTELRFEAYKMLGANLGETNPLPNIKNQSDIHSEVKMDDSLTKEERKYFNYGSVTSILPYLIQDGYDRKKELCEYNSVVLENDHLKAVFFPQFGGRLWSLYDKDHNRDLMHVNPVFQPANLALRNAWFSGGVEWNIGMTGHTPYTVSPLHTTTFKMSDGTPVLRIYEWERIRRVSYQIDAYLPEDSHFLFVRVRLCNTQDKETPIYWWSNIAVDETPNTRVLAPADEAFNFDYSRIMRKVKVPMYEGVDRSYTTHVKRSMDLFFDIKKSQRKWECVVDGEGKGLVQTSTDLLQGRKLFMWGNGVGGKRWQEFLSEPGRAYLEIQAGLANTQMEHLPMPAGAKWEWLEAYGMMQADPQKVHSVDWQTAYACVDEALEKLLPRAYMDEELKRLQTELDVSAAPVRLGSGWAALELKRITGEAGAFQGEKIMFTEDSLNEEQAPWLELLERGTFPNSDPSQRPAAFLTQPEWLPMLEQAVKSGKSNNWHAWLQLGVMYSTQGELQKAYDAFEASLNLTTNMWAKRNLAMLAMLEGDTNKAAHLLLEATDMLPILQLALECAQTLLKAGRYADFEQFYNKLPQHIREHGRMLTMRAQDAIMMDKFDLALDILNSDLQIDDVREGEVLLSDIWVMLHMRRLAKQEGIPEDDVLEKRVKREFPVPEKLDFRMSSEPL